MALVEGRFKDLQETGSALVNISLVTAVTCYIPIDCQYESSMGLQSIVKTVIGAIPGGRVEFGRPYARFCTASSRELSVR